MLNIHPRLSQELMKIPLWSQPNPLSRLSIMVIFIHCFILGKCDTINYTDSLSQHNFSFFKRFIGLKWMKMFGFLSLKEFLFCKKFVLLTYKRCFMNKVWLDLIKWKANVYYLEVFTKISKFKSVWKNLRLKNKLKSLISFV